MASDSGRPPTGAGAPTHGDSTLLKALLLVLVFAGWNALSDGLYQQLQLDSSSRTAPLRVVMILLGTLVTVGGVVGLGCVLWAKQSLRSLGWRVTRPLRAVGLGLLLTVLLFAAIFSFVALRGGMQGVRWLASAIAELPAGERAFFAIMGAKVAFAEETLFRGLLLPALARKSGAIVAVVLSSAVFALYHRSLFPLPLLLMKAILGAFFAVSTLASRSLVPAWLGHSLLWAIAADN